MKPSKSLRNQQLAIALLLICLIALIATTAGLFSKIVVLVLLIAIITLAISVFRTRRQTQHKSA